MTKIVKEVSEEKCDWLGQFDKQLLQPIFGKMEEAFLAVLTKLTEEMLCDIIDISLAVIGTIVDVVIYPFYLAYMGPVSPLFVFLCVDFLKVGKDWISPSDEINNGRSALCAEPQLRSNLTPSKPQVQRLSHHRSDPTWQIRSHPDFLATIPPP